MQLSKSGLNLKTIRHFIIDECDKVLENLGKHFEITAHTAEKWRSEDSFVTLKDLLFPEHCEMITDGELCAPQICAGMSRKFSSRRRTTSKS